MKIVGRAALIPSTLHDREPDDDHRTGDPRLPRRTDTPDLDTGPESARSGWRPTATKQVSSGFAASVGGGGGERRAAGFAAQGVAALSHRDGGDGQGGDRVGPGPAEQAVEGQAGEQDGGQVRAEQGLAGVGDRGAGAQFAAGPALGVGQGGHDHKGHRGQHQPGRRVRGRSAGEQGVDGVDRDVAGQREERDRDDAQRLPLPRERIAARELPGDGQSRGHLDDRVEAEADQRGRRGGGAGREGDDGLDQVVADAGGDQKTDATAQDRPPGHRAAGGAGRRQRDEWEGHQQQPWSAEGQAAGSTARTTPSRLSRACRMRRSASS